MGEFFKGWRRKAGCITLVMALAMMGMWMRSLSNVEYLDCSDTIIVISGNGRLVVAAHEPSVHHPFAWKVWHQKLMNIPEEYDQETVISTEDWTLENRTGYEWCVFGRHTYKYSTWYYNWVQATYWSIVIPLTLLSAYLLLWKPRKRTGSEHV